MKEKVKKIFVSFSTLVQKIKTRKKAQKAQKEAERLMKELRTRRYFICEFLVRMLSVYEHLRGGGNFSPALNTSTIKSIETDDYKSEWTISYHVFSVPTLRTYETDKALKDCLNSRCKPSVLETINNEYIELNKQFNTLKSELMESDKSEYKKKQQSSELQNSIMELERLCFYGNSIKIVNEYHNASEHIFVIQFTNPIS